MSLVSQRLFAATGVICSAILTAAAFFYAPSLGIFAGGFFGTCGLVIYDRFSRKNWEKIVSGQLKKIEEAQEELAGNVVHATKEIDALKDHITETAKNTRTAAHPQRAGRLIREVEEDIAAPRAERPATAAKRSYEDVVMGQPDLSDMAVQQVVYDAVKNERIQVFLQPIVRLPQRKVRFYELFARVRARPGLYLPAERYKKIAQENKMMQGIDRLLLTEVLDIVRETAKLERAAPFFINVTPASLKSAEFMNKLLAFLGNYRNLAERLVFEMPQQDFKALPGPVTEIIRALGKLGCVFSIDNVTDMNFNVQSLLDMKVHYIKMEAKDLVPRAGSDGAFTETLRLKRRLEGNGISVIAEKIETEKQLKELLDFDINYGQGHLFGKPDLQGVYQEKTSRGRRF